MSTPLNSSNEIESSKWLKYTVKPPATILNLTSWVSNSIVFILYTYNNHIELYTYDLYNDVYQLQCNELLYGVVQYGDVKYTQHCELQEQVIYIVDSHSNITFYSISNDYQRLHIINRLQLTDINNKLIKINRVIIDYDTIVVVCVDSSIYHYCAQPTDRQLKPLCLLPPSQSHIVSLSIYSYVYDSVYTSIYYSVASQDDSSETVEYSVNRVLVYSRANDIINTSNKYLIDSNISLLPLLVYYDELTDTQLHVQVTESYCILTAKDRNDQIIDTYTAHSVIELPQWLDVDTDTILTSKHHTNPLISALCLVESTLYALNESGDVYMLSLADIHSKPGLFHLLGTISPSTTMKYIDTIDQQHIIVLGGDGSDGSIISIDVNNNAMKLIHTVSNICPLIDLTLDDTTQTFYTLNGIQHNGSITIMQHTISSKQLLQFDEEFRYCTSIWCLLSDIIVATFIDSTCVLQVRDNELTDITNTTQLCNNQVTLGLYNSIGNTHIVQVTPTHILLIAIQSNLPANAISQTKLPYTITHCSYANDHVLIAGSNNTVSIINLQTHNVCTIDVESEVSELLLLGHNNNKLIALIALHNCTVCIHNITYNNNVIPQSRVLLTPSTESNTVDASLYVAESIQPYHINHDLYILIGLRNGHVIQYQLDENIEFQFIDQCKLGNSPVKLIMCYNDIYKQHIIALLSDCTWLLHTRNNHIQHNQLLLPHRAISALHCTQHYSHNHINNNVAYINDNVLYIASLQAYNGINTTNVSLGRTPRRIIQLHNHQYQSVSLLVACTDYVNHSIESQLVLIDKSTMNALCSMILPSNNIVTYLYELNMVNDCINTIKHILIGTSDHNEIGRLYRCSVTDTEIRILCEVELPGTIFTICQLSNTYLIIASGCNILLAHIESSHSIQIKHVIDVYRYNIFNVIYNSDTGIVTISIEHDGIATYKWINMKQCVNDSQHNVPVLQLVATDCTSRTAKHIVDITSVDTINKINSPYQTQILGIDTLGELFALHHIHIDKQRKRLQSHEQPIGIPLHDMLVNTYNMSLHNMICKVIQSNTNKLLLLHDTMDCQLLSRELIYIASYNGSIDVLIELTESEHIMFKQYQQIYTNSTVSTSSQLLYNDICKHITAECNYIVNGNIIEQMLDITNINTYENDKLYKLLQSLLLFFR